MPDMWDIEIRDVALDDLEELPANLRKRILRAIEERLGQAPDQYGERLRKSLAGFWKLRVGDYRIGYLIDAKAGRVGVWAVRHRREIYPELERRAARG